MRVSFVEVVAQLLIDCVLLIDSIIKTLKEYDVPTDDSRFVAETMVDADMSGYKEHGTIRLVQLIDGLGSGTISPTFVYKVLKNEGACCSIDAMHSIGQISSRYASQIAVQKAKDFGIGVCGIINASHVGRLANYTQLISEAECVGLAMTTSSPAAALPGGKKRIFGTNPIAYAIPSRGYPIVADFSTSKVSHGTVIGRMRAKKSIPFGWCIDKNGKPTDNPNVISDGGCLLPFDDGIKASAISLMISVIAGPLIGGVNNIFVEDTRYVSNSSKLNKGDVFIAIHIPHFSNFDDFTAAIEELKLIIENDESDFRVPGKRSFEAKKSAAVVEIDQLVADLIAEE
jgi:LDH2 family malate/lactate/ureidoglycolate dehydrogenase